MTDEIFIFVNCLCAPPSTPAKVESQVTSKYTNISILVSALKSRP